MAEKKVPNMRQVMFPTPPEAQVFWPGGQAPQSYPYPTDAGVNPGEMLRQFYARGVAPYVDPIKQGWQNGGVPGAVGGAVSSAGKGVGSVYDLLVKNPADQLEQWLPMGTLGDFGERLRSGLTGEPMATTPPPEAMVPPTAAQPATPGFNPLADMPQISGPFVPFNYDSTNVPAYPAGPDYGAAAPAQTSPDPHALQAAIMQGLYGGAAGTNTLASPSQLLFNLGMGALKGKADYQQQNAQDNKQFTAEQNAFKQWLAQQQGNEAARKAQYGLNTAEIQQRDNMTKAELEAKRMGQLQPKIEGGYAIVPSKAGDKINYSIQPLPNQKLQYAAALTTPQDIYDTILASPGGVEALTALTKDMNLALPAKFQAAGVNDKTIANTAVAQIVNQFAAQYPAEFQQIQQEAMLRRALGGK